MAYDNRDSAYLNNGDDDRAIADETQAIKARSKIGNGLQQTAARPTIKRVRLMSPSPTTRRQFSSIRNMRWLTKTPASPTVGGNDRAIADESQAIELDRLLNAARTPSLTHRL